ncbi:acyltransferase family protein [Hymenobacter radiodurans]|uniref:acyltransferase family protein n=1 Tax=Hymenobacter radiodurans TaxID=2496028 RepID=UPI0010588B37|nr:acyltransferase [Hymenobacter radiodurans]
MLLPNTGIPDQLINKEDTKIRYSLEALRGVAAFIVVWCHAIENFNFLDPHYSPKGVLAFLPPSHLSVLLFFVLSGYVIGLSTKQRLASKATIRTYLKKRFLRIYPIYFVSMVVAVLIAQPYPIKTLLGNFTLTQVLLTPLVIENGPSWSLHYEVLYYLLFIPISFFRVPPFPAAIICMCIGVANMYAAPDAPLLSSYAFGFAFWLVGLGLAHSAKHLPDFQTSYQVLIGMLLVLLSMYQFNILETVTLKVTRLLTGETLFFKPGKPYETQIRFNDMAFLPYAAAYILLFADKSFPYRRIILICLFGLPALTFGYLALRFKELDLASYILATFFYLMGIAAMLVKSDALEQLSQRLMNPLIKLGSISYGMYIIHIPILFIFHRVETFSGTALTYWVRFAIAIPAVILAAYWLEKKFQPRVRSLFH